MTYESHKWKKEGFIEVKRGGHEKQKRERILLLGDSNVSTSIRHRASRLFPRNLEGRAQNTRKKAERCIWKDIGKNLKGYTEHLEIYTIDLHYIFCFASKYNNGEFRDFSAGPVLRSPIQGVAVQLIVREDPTCHSATKPMLHNYWSQHPRAHAQHQEKPPQWEAQALQQQRNSAAKNKLKREFKEKSNTLDDMLNDMRYIYQERRNQGNIWPESGSLLLNHPHDGVTWASWLKNRCLIGSPATNSNLASIHGHTQGARKKKTANQEYSIQKSYLSEMKEK